MLPRSARTSAEPLLGVWFGGNGERVSCPSACSGRLERSTEPRKPCECPPVAHSARKDACNEKAMRASALPSTGGVLTPRRSRQPVWLSSPEFPAFAEPPAARVIVAFIGVEPFRPSARSVTLTPYRCDRVNEVVEHLGVVDVSAGKRYASRGGDDVPLGSRPAANSS